MILRATRTEPFAALLSSNIPRTSKELIERLHVALDSQWVKMIMRAYTQEVLYNQRIMRRPKGLAKYDKQVDTLRRGSTRKEQIKKIERMEPTGQKWKQA